MSNAFLRDSMLQLSIPTRDPVSLPPPVVAPAHVLQVYYIQDGNTVLLVGNVNDPSLSSLPELNDSRSHV